MDQEKNDNVLDAFEIEGFNEETTTQTEETTTEVVQEKLPENTQTEATPPKEETAESTTTEAVEENPPENKQPDEKTDNQEFETAPPPEGPKFEEVEEKQKKKRTDSYFDGSLIELIGYHLLSGIITIFTLGIGRPWAECLVMGYKINHTVYNGKRLRFEGKGANYFVQKFKWLIFTILTLGIYGLWVPIKKLKWQIKNTHFEDEEFTTDCSYFDGKLIQLIGINLLNFLIVTASFGILYPFAHCLKIRWTAKHTILNRKKIKFDGSALDLFAHYLLWIFLTIITFGIYGLWLGINYMKWQTKHTHIKLKDEEEKKNNNEMLFTIIIVAVIFIVGMFFMGKLLAALRPVNNETAVNNMKTTITAAKTEFANKQITDEEKESWETNNKRIKLQSIKKLNLDSLNTFDKNGGSGWFIYAKNDYTYNPNYANNTNVYLILKQSNMVCVTSLNTNQNIPDDTECKTLSEYLNLAQAFLQLNPVTAMRYNKVRKEIPSDYGYYNEGQTIENYNYIER